MTNELKEANTLLRSAYSIAERSGAETNWEAFKNCLTDALKRQSLLLNDTDYLPAATCTARTFRLPTIEVI